MPREGKSSATIRRRRIRNTPTELQRARASRPIVPEHNQGFNEEDEGYLFDDEVLGPSVVKKIMSSEKTLLLSLISFRVVNALFIQTHFVPDEYWQSLEVAHNMAFGYGHLTWEWQNGLRGYLYPSVFALLYKILAIIGLDNRLLLIKLPRLLQGVIAAYGDLYLYKLSSLLCDRATAQWTLLCQVVSWFMLYCSTRTLTNSTETVLCTMALYYFPWPGRRGGSTSTSRGSTWRFLGLAAVSVLVRPTAAVIWVLLCAWHVQLNMHRLVKTARIYITVGFLSLLLSAVIDRWFYGKWTLVQYNFLQFNVLGGGGAFYGTHPWHWYITQGYPVVMATHLVPFMFGVWKAKNKVLLFVIIWTVFIYSLLSHKEFRFLMPILPLSFHYCGVCFQYLCKKPRLKKKQLRRAYASGKTDNLHGSQESLVSSIDGTESTTTEMSTEASVISSETSGVSVESSGICTGSDVDKKSSEKEKLDDVCEEIVDNNEDIPVDSDLTAMSKKGDLSTNELIAEMEKKQRETHKTNLSRAKIFVIILLVTNIPVAAYFSLIHQRGTILVMKYLHDASLERKVDILFLMPCHSTPYYSYLHRNISMRFLTCEPNLQHVENYTDEAEIFFHSPLTWLKEEYSASSRSWPSHIVYFNPLSNQINAFLSQSGYKECASFFHTHLPEGRVGTHVIVSCR